MFRPHMMAPIRHHKAEILGRPSPSPRTYLKSADSDFENTSDSDLESKDIYYSKPQSIFTEF
jgi:hypothetical protein